MRISDWSSDVCSSDLPTARPPLPRPTERTRPAAASAVVPPPPTVAPPRTPRPATEPERIAPTAPTEAAVPPAPPPAPPPPRPEERRVGKDGVRPCISKWQSYYKKNKIA